MDKASIDCIPFYVWFLRTVPASTGIFLSVGSLSPSIERDQATHIDLVRVAVLL